VVGVSVWLLGPTVMFLLFHSDWETVPHLLTVDSPAEPLRLEVVDRAGQVVWAVERRGGPSGARNRLWSHPRRVRAIGARRWTAARYLGEAGLGLSYCDDKGGGAIHPGEGSSRRDSNMDWPTGPREPTAHFAIVGLYSPDGRCQSRTWE
jgi:hypothetical protein